jgi:hypothetical protein
MVKKRAPFVAPLVAVTGIVIFFSVANTFCTSESNDARLDAVAGSP